MPKEKKAESLTAHNSTIREPLFDFLEEKYGKIRILWRPELFDIQKKNNLPAYKGKSKAYVQAVILDRVPEDILWKQVSEELFERDYMMIADEIKDYRKKH